MTPALKLSAQNNQASHWLSSENQGITAKSSLARLAHSNSSTSGDQCNNAFSENDSTAMEKAIATNSEDAN